MKDYSNIQSIWDKEFNYVILLAAQTNFCYDEDGNMELGMWAPYFYNRLQHGKVKPPFTWEAFCDNTDVINTLEGYDLDIEKFWLVLLFIYDLTIDQTINVADFSKTNLETFVEIKEYIEQHPTARIYISDDEKISKKRRFEISDPWALYKISKFLDDEIKIINSDSQQKDSRNISFDKGYDIQLSPTLQMYRMALYLKTLYRALDLPEKRASYNRDATDAVSYNKMLLTSRLLHFCRFTNNEAFVIDDTSLKGIFKQCKGYKFRFWSKVYF